jgi:ADP-ribosylglycohydrolase
MRVPGASHDTTEPPPDWVERLYAGLLGKAIGVRHGSNVEGWTAERIRAAYGEVTRYLYSFRNFAADDDINGPLFFVRALDGLAPGEELEPHHVASALLNYVPHEHGFFWWGPYGTSTESTAYRNLRAGIEPPRSGSIEQNGAETAEQIGGQIFIDCWGLVAPGDPVLAAKLGRAAASVTHGGNGVFGGMFVAACIAAAFVERDIERVITAGLSVIPEDCVYALMVRDLVAFHERTPGDWRSCFELVRSRYWTDRYPGGCHVIPNAAIVVLSLLYGAGNFDDTVNICLMCGFDTDCNCGNAGTIAGVLAGLDGIDPTAWRAPINDLVICSSVIGSLNATDLARTASAFAARACRIGGFEPPPRWRATLAVDADRFDFELPGSTHAFRVATDAEERIDTVLANTDEQAHGGSRSLRVEAAGAPGGTAVRVFLKTFYQPQDFEDSRYDPAFSPLLYPGQRISACLMVPADTPCETIGCLYVRDRGTGIVHASERTPLVPGRWHEISWSVPPMSGACLEEAGVTVIPLSGHARTAVVVYVDDVAFDGAPEYDIDFARERIETWNLLHREVSQFTYLKGIWKLEDGALSGSCCDDGEAYTGGHAWTDYRFEAVLEPQLGERHNLNFRVQGAMRGYAVGLAPGDRLELLRNDDGYQPVRAADFAWHCGGRYELAVDVRGPVITVRGDGRTLIEHVDRVRPWLRGQVGVSVMAGSHCHFRDLRIGKPF